MEMDSSLRIFDELERTFPGPADYSEGHFSYYNRSARPAVAAIRARLGEMFSRYPVEHQAELRARFRSGDDRGFDSAFFELLLHELLLRLRCTVEVHPPVTSGDGKVPDFLAAPEDGEPFYVEAIVASALSDNEAARQSIMNVVYDQINKIESRNFFITISTIEGIGQRQPSGKRIRRFLETRLAALDPDRVAQDYTEGAADLPEWLYEEDKLKIEFGVVPKSTQARMKQGARSLGKLATEVKWGSDASSLRDAISRKAGRYGDLGHPYVIAINSTSKWGVEHTDVMEALFGTESFYLDRETLKEMRMVRNPDGALNTRRGATYTRVSAVLIAFGAYPASIANVVVKLYHNPWAKYLYSGPLCQLEQEVPVGDNMKRTPGISLGDLFGLNRDWPGD
ncbi:MAG TPA: hypothetical protein DHU55_00830 [Blastocatellia bacterium]|nr:hypothetical protein [Blastocatellia bacterium]